MPPPLRHLKRRQQFLRTAASGLKWVTPGVIVQARLRRDSATDAAAEGLGVGFTVSRKVGNAVHRNRARRRLRAAANEVLPKLGRDDVDYVLIGRQTTLVRPYRDLVDDLDQAVRRLNRKAEKPSETAR